MKHSQDKILTTHVGSLPRPRDMLLPLHARESGLPYDAAALEKEIDAAVANALHEARPSADDLVGQHIDWALAQRTVAVGESAHHNVVPAASTP